MTALTQESPGHVAADRNGAEYDYVVIGSGAGGGPVASNLARAGYRVLLLEAGGADDNYHYQVPVFHGLATEDEKLSWAYFVRHYADDDRQRRDSKFVAGRDGVFYPRAGTLGGCTAHNAMITVVPHDSDWDDIARRTGDSSWESRRMRRYFRRLERCRYVRPPGRDRGLWRSVRGLLNRLLGGGPEDGGHGFQGWLTTSEADPRLVLKDVQLLDVLLAAAKEAFASHLGRPLTRLLTRFDPNDVRNARRSPEGLCFTPLATDRGRRVGTREYIRATQQKVPDRLTVELHALVTRILLDDHNTAIGVEYLEGEHLYRADPGAARDGAAGVPRRVMVKREIILAAGAFNSPQLLMLSGIGPRAELERHGIPVRVELPGVGENLQDRYEVGVVTEVKEPFALFKGCTFEPPVPGQPPDAAFVEWEGGKGVYASNGVVVGLVKKSSSAQPDPDLYIFGLPGFFRGYFPGYSKLFERHRNIFTWAVLKAHTRNTAGRVRLRSADPRDTPDIVFHYFDEGNDTTGEDLAAVVDGVEFARKIMKQASLVTERELHPGTPLDTRAALEQFIKDEAWGHHASCSNKMGPSSDPLAVVDSRFRVHGTRNLRVVDASVFPRIPGFFIVTAIYMISEKATDELLADANGTTGGARHARRARAGGGSGRS